MKEFFQQNDILSLLKKYVKRNKLGLSLMSLSLAVVTAISINLPKFISDWLTFIETFELTQPLTIFLLLIILKFFFQYILNYQTHYLSNLFSQQIRGEIIEEITDADINDGLNYKTGDVIHRLFSELNDIQGKLIFGLLHFLKDIFFILILLLNISFLSIEVFYCLIVFVFSIIIYHKFIGHWFISINNKIQYRKSMLATFSMEVIHGGSEIKLYKIEKHIKNVLHLLIDKIMNSVKILAHLRAFNEVLMEFFLAVFLLCTMFILINKGLPTPELLILLTYLVMLIIPLKEVNNYLASLSIVIPSMQRVNEFLNNMRSKTHAARTCHNRVFAQPAIGISISIKNLNFRFPNSKHWVFANFSCSFTPGIHLIYGKNGKGKSTLLSMIAGLLRPCEGTILLNAEHESINLIRQTAFLFDDTFYNNLKIVKSQLTKKELLDIVKKYELTDGISGLKQGLNTVVGENGKLISGGQRQLINILRALILNPQILLMDEITNNLSEQLSKNILKNIEKFRKERITILVTHKLINHIKFQSIIQL